MKQVKEKLEKKLSSYQKKYPELVSENLHLASEKTGDFQRAEYFKSKVGFWDLDQWNKYRFVISKWNDLINEQASNHKIWINIGSYLRQYKFYHYSRQLDLAYQLTKEGK